MFWPTARDRIVLLGRRAAGKTVYLSVLYERYWKSLHGLAMKAVSGHVHTECIQVVEGLRAGVWPPATLEMRHCELEIDYRGQKQTMVALDYPGEVFRQAFVEGVTEYPGAGSPEASALIKHLDSAGAVLLLIDPASLCGDDVDAVIDDDFGVTQAVEYLRGSPGGEEVPIVLVYTKGDRTSHYVDRDGGLEAFTKKRLPALARTLRMVRLYRVEAVQTVRGDNREWVPKPHFKPRNIENPLIHCLDAIIAERECEQFRLTEVERQKALEARDRNEERRQRRANRILAAVIVSMIVIAACAIALILANRS